MSDKIEEKVQEALNRHNRGYNCSQSVACTFCEELGIDEATMFRMNKRQGGTLRSHRCPRRFVRYEKQHGASGSSGFQSGLL